MKSFAWAEARLILSNIKKPVMGVCAGAMCVLGGCPSSGAPSLPTSHARSLLILYLPAQSQPGSFSRCMLP